MKIVIKSMIGTYGSGRFCSIKCARSFSTKNKRKEINEKVSKKLTEQTHLLSCIKCGTLIEKTLNVHKAKCDKCLIEEHTCKICGANNKSCKRPDICKRYKIFPTLIKYFGFNKLTLGTENAILEFERIKNLIYEDYYDNENSITNLMKKYHYYNNPMNFSKILDSLNITRRNLSEAQQILLKNKKTDIPVNTKYKSCWHTTWNNKQFFLRSSYELDYAKYLDNLKIDYECENLRILYWDSQKHIQRIAIPDFYLPDTNEIIEIKSSWTYNEQNMKDKFKEYIRHGYKPKLILNKIETKLIIN